MAPVTSAKTRLNTQKLVKIGLAGPQVLVHELKRIVFPLFVFLKTLFDKPSDQVFKSADRFFRVDGSNDLNLRIAYALKGHVYQFQLLGLGASKTAF